MLTAFSTSKYRFLSLFILSPDWFFFIVAHQSEKVNSEQRETVDNCFPRSECVETRSISSRTCPAKKCETLPCEDMKHAFRTKSEIGTNIIPSGKLCFKSRFDFSMPPLLAFPSRGRWILCSKRRMRMTTQTALFISSSSVTYGDTFPYLGEGLFRISYLSKCSSLRGYSQGEVFFTSR